MPQNSRLFARIGSAVNPTANERRSMQPEVGLFGEEILREGDAFEENIREECPDTMQDYKSVRATVVIPWLT